MSVGVSGSVRGNKREWKEINVDAEEGTTRLAGRSDTGRCEYTAAAEWVPSAPWWHHTARLKCHSGPLKGQRELGRERDCDRRTVHSEPATVGHGAITMWPFVDIVHTEGAPPTGARCDLTRGHGAASKGRRTAAQRWRVPAAKRSGGWITERASGPAGGSVAAVNLPGLAPRMSPGSYHCGDERRPSQACQGTEEMPDVGREGEQVTGGRRVQGRTLWATGIKQSLIGACV